MAYSSTIIALLSFTTVFSAVRSRTFATEVAAVPPSPTLTKTSYFILALQWPQSYCTATQGSPCKKPIPDDFKIHGFWPEAITGATPTDCKKENFDVNNVKGFKNEVDLKWPNLLLESNEKFWGEQWSKHGNCSQMDQTLYFRKALECYDKVKLKSQLQSRGVIPSKTKVYSLQKLSSELNLIYKVDVKVTCVDNASLTKIQQLKEVHFNISASTFEVQPYIGKTNACDSTRSVMYPSP